MIVEFENGYIVYNVKYHNFKNGEIKNPYDKYMYNIGYIGVGKYNSYNMAYSHWSLMFDRCYSQKWHSKHSEYIGCTICEDWHNYQNFAKWFEQNYYQVNNEKMHLDKDILVKGNKIYSPNTCVFVPERINYLFIKKDANRGKYPIGVSFRKDSNKFSTQISKIINGNHKIFKLGSFNNPIDAFNKYKFEKEIYIKEVADEYKDVIPSKLYDAMYNWVVEITD